MAGVEHLVSRVEGRLRPDVSWAAAMQALFPGGSVTGAPKIAALDHINALEPVGRGAAMGALGTIWPNGDFELALTIRTFAIRDERIHLWVGGGVVWDSDPSSEVEESWTKARPLLEAIKAAHRARTGRLSPPARPLAVAVLGQGVIDPDRPVIHADDRGLLRGLAAFETLRVYAGRPFAMPEHLARLAASAARMHLTVPDLEALSSLASEAITAAGVADCTLRLTLTGGREGGQPVALAIVGALPTDLDTLRAQGIGVVSLRLGTDPRARQDAPWLLTGVKSTSYAVNMAAHEEAARRGAGDAIFVAADGIGARRTHDQRLVAAWRHPLHAGPGPGHPGRRHACLRPAPGLGVRPC